MKNDPGKVILSLLAGATAGIVAGLLLAPETGDATRATLRRSAAKWGDDLSKLVKNARATAQSPAPGHTNPDAAVSEDKAAADALLNSLGATPGIPMTATDDRTTPAGDWAPAETA